MEDNAWRHMTPDDYDAHMAHPNVGQVQLLGRIIKEQFNLIPAEKRADSCAAILGITSGNGLEHVNSCGVGRVIGIDINEAFLGECKVRYADLSSKLRLYRLDLMTEISDAVTILSGCDLVIANLLIEHIHLENFGKIVAALPKRGQIISCVIQANPDGFIASASGSEHLFADIIKQVEEEDEEALDVSMRDCGYSLGSRMIYNLPNGKYLIRSDYTAV